MPLDPKIYESILSEGDAAAADLATKLAELRAAQDAYDKANERVNTLSEISVRLITIREVLDAQPVKAEPKAEPLVP
jgi:hypothetical protein